MNSGERGEPVIIKGYPSLFAGVDCFEECDGFYERPRLSPRPRADLFPVISGAGVLALSLAPIGDSGVPQWGYFAGVGGGGTYPFATRWEGVATDDGDTSYMARNGPPATGGSYTDRFTLPTCPTGRTWRLQLRARVFTTPPAAGQMVLQPFLVDNGGNRFEATLDLVGKLAAGWQTVEVPLAFSIAGQPNHNTVSIGIGISPFAADYVLVTSVRVLSP